MRFYAATTPFATLLMLILCCLRFFSPDDAAMRYAATLYADAVDAAITPRHYMPLMPAAAMLILLRSLPPLSLLRRRLISLPFSPTYAAAADDITTPLC